MKVAIARPAEARPNTSFAGQLNCYEKIVQDYDIEIDLIANSNSGLETDHVNLIKCDPTPIEIVCHNARQIKNRVLNQNKIVMHEYSSISEIILSRDYDVVEVGDPSIYPTAYTVLEACQKKSDSPNVVPLVSATKPIDSIVDHEKSREVFRMADKLLFTTPKVADRLIMSKFLSQNDNRIIYLGHPIDTINFSGNVNNSKGGCINILSVGRIEERKGYKLIAQACKQLSNDGYNFCWHIVGDGELREWLINYLDSNNLSNYYEYHGIIPYESMPTMYSNSDLFVLHSIETTTWEEYFGVAYAEAMSSKLPIVGSKSGAIPWVVRDQKDGILVEEGDIKGIHDAIETLINNAELRKMMGKNGRENVRSRFSIEKVMRNFVSSWTNDSSFVH